jgi:hypothetical protein
MDHVLLGEVFFVHFIYESIYISEIKNNDIIYKKHCWKLFKCESYSNVEEFYTYNTVFNTLKKSTVLYYTK